MGHLSTYPLSGQWTPYFIVILVRLGVREQSQTQIHILSIIFQQSLQKAVTHILGLFTLRLMQYVP